MTLRGRIREGKIKGEIMKSHYETIVVGAGAAGMNCCLELQKNDGEIPAHQPEYWRAHLQ